MLKKFFYHRFAFGRRFHRREGNDVFAVEAHIELGHVAVLGIEHCRDYDEYHGYAKLYAYEYGSKSATSCRIGKTRFYCHRSVCLGDVERRIYGRNYCQYYHKHHHSAYNRNVVGKRERTGDIVGDEAVLQHQYKIQCHKHGYYYNADGFEKKIPPQGALACTKHFADVYTLYSCGNKCTEEVDKVDKRNKDNGKSYGTEYNGSRLAAGFEPTRRLEVAIKVDFVQRDKVHLLANLGFYVCGKVLFLRVGGKVFFHFFLIHLVVLLFP